MDLMRKKDILALPELPDQRTQISAVKQSAATVRDSATPLRGWVCHLCAHFNTPGTLASPNGPCQTCNTPACDAECADAIVTPRDNPYCAGFTCWYCKYFWVWSDYDDDGKPIQDEVLSCNVCGILEEEEVVFVKSCFEGTKKLEPEPGQGEERLLVYEETKDKKSEEREVDDGEGAFIVVDRKRARPKKKVQNEGVDDGDNVRFTEVGQKKARQKRKIPDNLLATGGIPQYALRRPGRPIR
ncbi:hypothetical protein AA0113_g636 [Alternaria arborescens]|uniref:Uncharacterized protein n=1 Tax=Alternaria arborescens TaxID=156630 RepID=A0A4Q4SR46_9PLEO|nr:hypothetical protein AA0111_g3204 [Alternaria arborescens]RYO34937.1 hypothetical protein AA0111_g3204 [Alternaria arborescens]RYO73091.1 hypothetical protein AA0113_g636 [Alternaria arborescens]